VGFQVAEFDTEWCEAAALIAVNRMLLTAQQFPRPMG
jgi:hypothetical protein